MRTHHELSYSTACLIVNHDVDAKVHCLMPSFIQPRTIHIHEHEIISPEDWPEEVGVLVKALKLRADDSAFPAIPPTVRVPILDQDV